MPKATVSDLARLIDSERSDTKKTMVSVWLTDSQFAALGQIAKKARITRSGVLRLGLQLASQAVLDG